MAVPKINMFTLFNKNKVHSSNTLFETLQGIKPYELWRPANQDFCNLIAKNSFVICCGFYRTSTECESDTRWRGFDKSIHGTFEDIRTDTEAEALFSAGTCLNYFAHPDRTTCIGIHRETITGDLYVITASTRSKKDREIIYSVGRIPYIEIQYLSNYDITEWLKESVMKVLDAIGYEYPSDFYFDESFLHSHGVTRYIKY